MSGVSVGQRAVELPWLCPSVEALLALAADPPDPAAVFADLAAGLHVLRFARPSVDFRRFHPADLLTQPSLCDTSAAFLERAERPVRFSDDFPEFATIARVSSAAAEVAGELAREADAGHPDLVALVARSAVLGWVAVAAVDPDSASRVLQTTQDPTKTQERDWGLDAAAIARRLASRWRLPDWLTTTIGFLRLTPNDAADLGAQEELFRVVQAAVAVAEEHFGYLGLTDPRTRGANTEFDTQARSIVERIAARQTISVDPTPSPDAPTWILAKLLRSAAVARRATGAVWLSAAEGTIDRLVDNLGELRAEFATNLRDAKLESIAEFAAGASHEINNPLAVISGHAQLLMTGESDPERKKQLAVIVRQTKRVHELLQGTLQFARPNRPSPNRIRLREWLDRAVQPFYADAVAVGITLEIVADKYRADCELRADAVQLSTALGHLLRNAIDAAPTGGRVSVGVEYADGPQIVVEDDGPGPTACQIPHLFDPFFSGRTAGRGRGLGLSIAWRFARLNGGDVRFQPTAERQSRFVLQLPPAELPQRMSA